MEIQQKSWCYVRYLRLGNQGLSFIKRRAVSYSYAKLDIYKDQWCLGLLIKYVTINICNVDIPTGKLLLQIWNSLAPNFSHPALW